MKINRRGAGTQLRQKPAPSRVSVSLWLTLLLFSLACAQTAAAQESVRVGDAYRAGDFELVRGGRAADVYVSDGDFKVVRIAADDLAADVERVTGVRPAVRTGRPGESG